MRKAQFVITAIDHIVLRVREPRKVMEFYRDVLGCRLEREQADIGLIQLRAGRSLIDLVSAGLPSEAGQADKPDHLQRNLDHFCLTLTPFDESELRQHFEAHGIVVVDPRSRFGAEGDGRSFLIQDPEGNRIELKEALHRS